MKGLGADERRKITPASRKLLEKMSSKPLHGSGSVPANGSAPSGSGRRRGSAASSASATAPLSAPLPRAIKERQERKAGYEATKEEVAKWQPMVKVGGSLPRGGKRVAVQSPGRFPLPLHTFRVFRKHSEGRSYHAYEIQRNSVAMVRTTSPGTLQGVCARWTPTG